MLILLGKLHFYPSSFSNFPIKSLNFQFNQFNPYLPNISLTKYFTWKSKFTLNINLLFYLSKPSNFYCRTIVRKFTDITIYPLIKISSSKFTYQLYWKDEGIELTHLLLFPTWLPHTIDPSIELSLIEKIFVLNTWSILSKTVINCSS